jgi:aromatic ring hydroxylase
MTRFTDNPSLLGNEIAEVRLRRVEENLQFIQDQLYNSYFFGRLRTDRTTGPASSADVNSTDAVYDVIRDTNYEYVLINNGGTLAWRRISYSAF